jgi:hypothetical protein
LLFRFKDLYFESYHFDGKIFPLFSTCVPHYTVCDFPLFSTSVPHYTLYSLFIF